jgi:hypothetical protein
MTTGRINQIRPSRRARQAYARAKPPIPPKGQKVYRRRDVVRHPTAQNRAGAPASAPEAILIAPTEFPRARSAAESRASPDRQREPGCNMHAPSGGPRERHARKSGTLAHKTAWDLKSNANERSTVHRTRRCGRRKASSPGAHDERGWKPGRPRQRHPKVSAASGVNRLRHPSERKVPCHRRASTPSTGPTGIRHRPEAAPSQMRPMTI